MRMLHRPDSFLRAPASFFHSQLRFFIVLVLAVTERGAKNYDLACVLRQNIQVPALLALTE